jgi:hypothetical protein
LNKRNELFCIVFIIIWVWKKISGISFYSNILAAMFVTVKCHSMYELCFDKSIDEAYIEFSKNRVQDKMGEEA